MVHYAISNRWFKIDVLLQCFSKVNGWNKHSTCDVDLCLTKLAKRQSTCEEGKTWSCAKQRPKWCGCWDSTTYPWPPTSLTTLTPTTPTPTPILICSVEQICETSCSYFRRAKQRLSCSRAKEGCRCEPRVEISPPSDELGALPIRGGRKWDKKNEPGLCIFFL